MAGLYHGRLTLRERRGRLALALFALVHGNLGYEAISAAMVGPDHALRATGVAGGLARRSNAPAERGFAHGNS